MTVGEVMNSIISLDKCKPINQSDKIHFLYSCNFKFLVFDPDGPMYSPMVNPEDPALGSEDDENAALDGGAETSQRNHLE